LCTFGNKCLDYLQFFDAASFKTTRIVKTKTRSTLKYHLVLDIVLSTLKRFSCYRALIKAPYPSGRRDDRRINLYKEEHLSTSSFIAWLLRYYLVAFWIKNFRLLGRVANVLEYGGLASICSPDYQNPKPLAFFLELFSEVWDFVIHVGSGSDQRWRAGVAPSRIVDQGSATAAGQLIEMPSISVWEG
jgi:hypothetical protein